MDIFQKEFRVYNYESTVPNAMIAPEDLAGHCPSRFQISNCAPTAVSELQLSWRDLFACAALGTRSSIPNPRRARTPAAPASQDAM
mgnify:CR=1 FL=1